MPRSTRSVTYGPEYEQLLLRAQATPGYAVTFESATQAKALKAKVYAYFKALRTEALRPDLVQMSEALAMHVEHTSLCFSAKEDSWDAVALRSALGLQKGFAELGGRQVVVSPKAKDAMLEKLAEIRKGKQG